MPQPLLDRMEIIRLEGYTEDEKVEIAKRHLIPKQMEAHGLKPEELHAGLRSFVATRVDVDVAEIVPPPQPQ